MPSKQFCPPIPFEWTETIFTRLEELGVKVTTTTFCGLLIINRAYKMQKSAKELIIPHSSLKHFRISRQTMHKILKNLEKAGFIHLHGGKGRSPKVDLLLLPPPSSVLNTKK